MTEVDQYRATCFHEAAHAVFALKVSGYYLQYASADESYCAAKCPVFDGYADHWRRAMYSLAGRFAEQLEIWGEIRPDSWEAFWEDAVFEAEDESMRGDTFDLMEDL